jgi:hypothetical protein
VLRHALNPLFSPKVIAPKILAPDICRKEFLVLTRTFFYWLKKEFMPIDGLNQHDSAYGEIKY